MRKTFSLLALSLGILLFSTAAKADTTVTFTLTCDKNVTAVLTPTAVNKTTDPPSIWLVNLSNDRVSCHIEGMSCDASHKTDIRDCVIPADPISGSNFVPTNYFTSDALGDTLTATGKNGRSTPCIAEGATDGTSFTCDPPSGGAKSATFKASSPSN